MARLSKKVRKYSEEDLLLIAQMENKIEDIKRVAEKLNRTPEAIRLRKWQLEHKAHRKRTQDEFKKRYEAQVKSTKNKSQRWSKKEELMVLESKLTDFQLANLLKRTLSSISAKRHRLLKDKKYGKRKK